MPNSLVSEQHTLEMRWYPEKGRACLTLSTDSGHMDYEVVLLDYEHSHLKASCIGRPRHDDFISVDLMKNWISDCEKHHTAGCCTRIPPPGSLSWMIDTWSCCLVPAVMATRYVALSYVWGQTKMFKASTETLDALQKNGALGTDTHWNLPNAIRHAITLVPQLGERYLWIDSLCIMQDDAECLERHIRDMDSIYAAAVFTIVVAGGENAEYGIPGLRGISRARELSAPLKLTSRLGLKPRTDINITFSPWGSRGWTLQENVFSKRKIVFIHESVQWICQEHRCFEDIYQPHSLIPKTGYIPINIHQELDSCANLSLECPHISQLERILQQYSTRRLTFEEDVLRAISAVFTAHHKAFPSGFFWGLPVDYFDMALLWSPFYYSTRRQAHVPFSPHLFPSWTWAGWVGELRHGQWPSSTYRKSYENINFREGKYCVTIPMLEWHSRPPGQSKESLIPGQNKAHTYKQRFMGKKDGLPHGWKYKREPFWSDSAYDKWERDRPEVDTWNPETPYYYSHEAAPGVKFWHPVPISQNPPSDANGPIGGRLLYAKTQRGCFWLANAKDHPASFQSLYREPPARTRACVHLFGAEVEVDTIITNAKGDLVGDLIINERMDCQVVKDYKCQRDEAGCPCELVAISKGNNLRHPVEPPREKYTFYNVLWIKWEDGIAYRRGVGRVKRQTWESMELEDIDLVLG